MDWMDQVRHSSLAYKYHRSRVGVKTVRTLRTMDGFLGLDFLIFGTRKGIGFSEKLKLPALWNRLLSAVSGLFIYRLLDVPAPSVLQLCFCPSSHV